MKEISIKDLVMTLNGQVYAVGEHNTDQERLENLKNLTEIVESLIFQIEKAATSADRQEASMKAIGEYAKQWLSVLKDNI